MYNRVILLCLVFKLICGDHIAQRLIKRYNDVRSECPGNEPAFKCSGLMIRGLANIGGREQKYAWSKKQSNVRKNAFSVSYLRQDQQFNKLESGYESGFIYYPHLKTPKNKYAYRAYCAFPINAGTDFRTGPHGCGPNPYDLYGSSRSCDAQGITSLKRWTALLKNFKRSPFANSMFQIYQCSFDMTNSKNAAKNFAVSLEAKKYLRHASREYSLFHNEIVIKAWSDGHPEKLPIEAFFYLTCHSNGRKQAFQYQRDYFKLTHETIPVVGIRLPTTNDSNLIVV